MTDSNTHRILRQVLEVEFDRPERAIELQNAVTQLFQEQGLATMETLFDQLVGPEQLIRLERVEVHLGELRGSNWMEQFNPRLLDQLQSRLEQIIPSSAQPGQIPPFSGNTQEGLFQQLLYICQHGRFPWWGGKPSGQWLETLLSAMTLTQWQTLAQLLHQNTRALRRLIYIANDEFLQTIPQRLSHLAESATVLVRLAPDNLSRQARLTWRERFWVKVLGNAMTGTTAPRAGPKLMQQLLTERQTLIQAHPMNPPETGVSRSNAEPVDTLDQIQRLPQPWQTWLEDVISSFRAAPSSGSSVVSLPLDSPPVEIPQAILPSPPQASEEEPLSTEPSNLASPHSPNLPTQHQTSHAAEGPAELRPHATDALVARSYPPAPPFALNEQAPISDITESIEVAGAGAVLLHPFLQELVSSLDLLSDRQFRNQQTQQCAVALLTYLTYGNFNVPEYELLLPKLLCAWPWEEPLPPWELDEAERNACEELLNAVLNHWSALRSSSADWLRQQFFWRNGTLMPVDGGWQLTIERRAQDVLLNKLPWGVGVIRLPWMANFLYVNWT